jgi:hypothetical protein
MNGARSSAAHQPFVFLESFQVGLVSGDEEVCTTGEGHRITLILLFIYSISRVQVSLALPGKKTSRAG